MEQKKFRYYYEIYFINEKQSFFCNRLVDKT